MDSSFTARPNGDAVSLMLSGGGFFDTYFQNTDVIEANEHNEWTNLHWACISNDLERVKMAIKENKCHVDAQDSNGMTPLHWACYEGLCNMAKLLIEEYKADVCAKDKGERTPLHWALVKGHLEIAKYLLAEHEVGVGVGDKYGRTPLHLALKHGYFGITKLLIEDRGVDVRVRDADGVTPLHLALKYGRLEMVKFLIEEHKVKVDIQDSHGWTPLHWTCINDNKIMAKYLTEEHEANVDTQDNIGMTPLHWACYRGLFEMAKYLIEKHKADVALKDEGGRAPIHWALDNGNFEIALYLMSACHVDVGAGDKYGITPLHLALKRGNLEVARVLIEEHGVDFLVRDKNGMAPVDFAIKYNHLEKAKKFIENYKVKVDVQENNGRKMLYWAFKNGELEFSKYLIADKKIVDDIRDDGGRTPLHWASRNGDSIMVKYLIRNCEADLNAQDNDGATPLHWALKYGGDKKVIKLLILEGANLEKVITCKDVIEHIDVTDWEEKEVGVFLSNWFLSSPSEFPKNALEVARNYEKLSISCYSNDALRAGKCNDACKHIQLGLAACLQFSQGYFQKAPSVLLSEEILWGAVRDQRKVLISQPVIQELLKNKWKGVLNEIDYFEDFFTFIFKTILNIALAVIVTLWPPLECYFEDFAIYNEIWFVFSYYTVMDVLFVTLLAIDSIDHPSWLLQIWCGSLLYSEVLEFLLGDGEFKKPDILDRTKRKKLFSLYFTDMWNYLEILGYASAMGSLVVSSESKHAEDLRSLALLLLFLRLTNLLTLSRRVGPYVLMIKSMISDVGKWLIISIFILFTFSIALHKVHPTCNFEDYNENDIFMECDATMTKINDSYRSSFKITLDLTLSQQTMLLCTNFISSDQWMAHILIYMHTVMGIILLLNMLIALLTKTFDNQWELMSENIGFLYAQRVVGLQRQPPGPSAFQILSLPFNILSCMIDFKCDASDNELQKEKEIIHNQIKDKKLNESFREKLPTYCGEYILDRQNVIACNERWRTSLSKAVGDMRTELHTMKVEKNMIHKLIKEEIRKTNDTIMKKNDTIMKEIQTVRNETRESIEKLIFLMNQSHQKSHDSKETKVEITSQDTTSANLKGDEHNQ